ncbi:SNF2-related protein [Photobacterium alginatilyticum]|uniref:DEAD/DEAH box helicase n=1 Tax=Photobacterium alginatilyticum TaxID=1775171 RepID=A0ABW9YKI5_9GAMM|nr:SNF2-related protein [Photobacterium alginatilyticum]NBI53733.1 DEAD/DEAH box helicase [Photobacterium alginatilyticum]
MNYSPHQQAWLAHSLTLAGKAEDSMTQTIASAKVDMNPHQVEAALFALASPLSSGVILADEVGLGKTIEASLVLAQKWAERRRKLLLVVPATLRKQWSQELEEKFSLPSVIIEAKSFNQTLRQGYANPFDLEVCSGKPAICICSYEFAARKESELARVPWDLAVLDEAHKLRNIYKKDGAKTARKLDTALAGRKKVLLSATPLQNSILELYGLVSVIDPHYFGDLGSFKARYAKQNLEEVELALLRNRLSRVCNRTLRRQVQEEGGISFTRRYSMTEDFRPTANEEKLYQEVSEYLQRDDLLSIKPGARHLVTLVIRKILASSTYAVQGTLETMIQRLERQQPLVEALQDYDNLEDYQDEDAIDDEDLIDPKALQAEIELLKEFKSLAGSVTGNAKAEALMRVLHRAFSKTLELGGARKAVIFTESVRTQTWLAELLAANGYADEIVLLNGSNSDAASKAIYKDWLAEHQGSSRVSGSKTADMKAALVDKFRNDATLMICTEAGAEGINLQFCSLLVNYDLPWNPQRVEQRIGRVHRYGQKHDVVVVNFINKGNRADERVFELLSQKFQLFEGVFGASDEVLGSIESGVDIERRIHDIYQYCRSDEQIEAEFNQLQEQLKDQLEVKVNDTRKSLLEHFDADVVSRLNTRRGKVVSQLSNFQQQLLLLARMALSTNTLEYSEHENGFSWQGQRYNLNWQEADSQDQQFFRLSDGLGANLINKLKSVTLPTVSLPFVYSPHQGQWVDVKNLIGQQGNLRVVKVSVGSSEELREKLLLTTITDCGESIHPETAERLLQMPIVTSDTSPTIVNSDIFEADEASQLQAFMDIVERDNELYYSEEVEKLERWAEDKRVALDIRVKQLDQEIKQARKSARQLATLQEKMAAKRDLKRLERERDTVMLNYHEEKKKIEQEEDRLLEEIETRLAMDTKLETIFEASWTLHESESFA